MIHFFLTTKYKFLFYYEFIGLYNVNLYYIQIKMEV